MQLIAFALLLLTALVSAQSEPKPIIFCSYNVRNYLGDDQAAPPKFRAKPKTEKELNALLSVIRDINPDILGVCEMGSKKMFEDFKSRLTKAGLLYPHSEYLQAGDPDRHLALVSKFPIIATHSQKNVPFILKGTPEEMKRGILDVTIRITPDYSLRCVGVHLKSKLPTPQGEALIRRNEAIKLREHLDGIFAKNPDVNLLCYGDVNDTRNEPVFQEIAGIKTSPKHMTDLWAKDSLGDRWTHYWRYADQYSRIDYIFVSKGLWTETGKNSARVYRSPYWEEASDHRPIYVSIIPVEKK